MDAKDTSGNKSTPPNRVVIELGKSLAAQDFKDGDGLIQRSAMQDARRFACDTANKIADFKKELENKERPPLVRSRLHETIFITGERGSGKTTFMLSVLIAAETGFSNGSGNCAKEFSFEPLRIIDPTHLTDKQHIFVNIIALIKEAVDRHFKDNKVVEQREALEREWKEMLSELSRGLCNQDGIGSNKLQGSEWDDPQYILKEGLEDAQSGLLLEWRFHRFVNASLKIIDQDAFVLCFDDIDTSFDKGWPVLELLRKHLTTPQIIVLLSGEFALYSKLVRREQWKLFSGNASFISHCKQEQLEKEVQRLEEQYLTKILPPRKRIDLKCAWELPNDLYLRIPGPEPRQEILLRHVMTAFTKVWFQFPTGICKRIGELFLHMPMRSLVSILKIIDDNGRATAAGYAKPDAMANLTYEYAKIFSQDDLPEDSTFDSLDKPNAHQILSVHSALILANQDRLMALGFTQDDLRTILWTGQFSKLAQVLEQRELLEHGASLLPSNVMQQDGLEILLLSGIYLSTMLADIKHVGEYYVRVIMVRDYYEFMHSKTTTNEERKKIVAELKQLTSPQRSLHEISLDIASLSARDELKENAGKGTHVELKSNSFLQNVTDKWTGKGWPINYGQGHSIDTRDYNPINDYKINEWGRLLFNTLSVYADDKYYVSAYNFVALFGLCLGSGSSLDFDLKRFQRIESIDYSSPGSPTAPKYYTDKLKPIETGALDESFKRCTLKIQEWASVYHKNPDLQKKCLLPPYVHANIWNSFCARLRGIGGIDAVGPLGRLYICFTSAVRDEEMIFRTANNDAMPLPDLSYYKFVFECPLWLMLETLEAHLVSSGDKGSERQGSKTAPKSGNPPKSAKKPPVSSPPPRAPQAALQAKESPAAPASKAAPAKRPAKAKPAKK